MMIRTLLTASCLVAFAASAQAQTPVVKPSAPAGCKAGAVAPLKPGATTGTAQPLSDKLADSNGVLCPPSGIDPEIHAPTPQTGTMPVIPPPGSPGGDPTVQPK